MKGRVFCLVFSVLLIAGCASSSGSTSFPAAQSINADFSAESSQSETVLTVGNAQDTATLLPFSGGGTANANIVNQIYDGLTGRDETGQIVPAIASSWEAVDDVTWIFKLRDDVVFHNGEKCDATAVKFTADLALDPNSTLPANRSDISDVLEAVEIVDDYTIRFITKEPFAGLPLRLFSFKVFPPKYFAEMGQEYVTANPVGTGAFKFVSWEKDKEVVLEANPDYFRGAPKIDRLIIKVIPNETTRVAALESGELDIISAVPNSQIARLSQNQELLVTAWPTTRSMFVAFNTYTSPALQDPRVRRALNHAVDVDSILENALDGHGRRLANVLFNPSYTAFDEAIQGYAYDTELARSLLREAGYADSLNLSMCFAPGKFMNDSEVVQIIVAQLAEVGVTVNLTEKESGLMNNEMKSHTIDDLWFNGLGGPTADGDLMTQVGWTSDGRYSCWSDPELDALYSKAITTVDSQKAAEVWKQIQQKMTDDAPGIALYQYYDIYAYKASVKGWTPKADQIQEYFNCYFE